VLSYPSEYTYGYAMSPATVMNNLPDLSKLVYAQTDPSVFPPVTMESGTQDYTVSIESVRSFVSILQDGGVRVQFIERNGGHDWNFWPVCLEKALVKIGESFK
jgi:S-formylglutathione hydrolase FrmB